MTRLVDLRSGAVARAPRWLQFDAIWYEARYGQTARFYAETGGPLLAHSPGPLFDEQWYRAAHYDVRAEIAAGLYASGFEQYCARGHLDRSPNSVFDEAYYRAANPDIFVGGTAMRGYANGYDHYLTQGAHENRPPSRFFDEAVWRMSRPAASGPDAEGRNSLEHYLRADHGTAAEPRFARTSWYFDPDWYLARYPDVAAAIALGQWATPLAHYLGNWWATRFDPNAWFSEAHYLATYPDVLAGVRNGGFRNGYAHFLGWGIAEGREPRPGWGLARYEADPEDTGIDGAFIPDAFAAHVVSCFGQGAALKPGDEAERHARRVVAANARVTAATLLRQGLDFSLPDGCRPCVSVIMVLHNQFDLTAAALMSLKAQGVDLELLLVDSGSSDETTAIERVVRGAHVIRLPGNDGFIAGCNAALLHATADAVLYLNNDVALGPGALAAALRRLSSRPDAGAVGGRIVRLHGRLQEAGCIVWRDGATTGYLRDRPADTPEADFVREVDFCSAAFLLVRASLARDLGGFDPVFAPAYYEDADFCIRLRRAGYVVLYDPDVLVHHHEYGSSSSIWAAARMESTRELFRARHTAFLRHRYVQGDTAVVRARTAGDPGRRILFIEDRLPCRMLGSGYIRSNDIIRAMVALGCAVTVFPMHGPPPPRLSLGLGRDFPDTVELMHDRTAASLGAFLTERSGLYDIIWIGRTHNLRAVLPVLRACCDHIPQFGLILDTEAVAAPREMARRRLDPGEQDIPALDDALREELACAAFCQTVIAVNEADAAHIRASGHDDVDVLGHVMTPRPTPRRFADRHGLLFIGAMHAADAPNYDSMMWFTRHVLPIIRRGLGADVRLTIAGHAAPGVDTGPLAREPGVDVLGAVEDLSALYGAHRVFVAPTRYAGGIPYKVHEAASFGLPVVASTVLCAQLSWTEGAELLDGGANDAAYFGRQVARLYRDEPLWSVLRANALERLTLENNETAFQSGLAGILDRTLARGPAAAGPFPPRQ